MQLLRKLGLQSIIFDFCLSFGLWSCLSFHFANFPVQYQVRSHRSILITDVFVWFWQASGAFAALRKTIEFFVFHTFMLCVHLSHWNLNICSIFSCN